MSVVRFSGFGGQGVVLAARVLGSAAAESGKFVVQTQSYGSAARGGASRADVAVSDEPIYDISPDRVDVLVAMSQPAFRKHIGALKQSGLLIYDESLVNADWDGDACGVDGTRFCKKEFGRALFANMFLVGFVTAVLDIASLDSIRRSVREKVRRAVEKNLAAVEAGYRLGLERRRR